MYTIPNTNLHLLIQRLQNRILTLDEIKRISKELTQDLNDVRDHVKIKDEEILRLRHEIANLNTMVQIETLKSELANLKSMAGNYYKK